MKLLLTAGIVLAVVGWDMFMLFFAWFTLGFFGMGPAEWLIALASLVVGGIVTAYSVVAVRRIRYGNMAI